MGLSSEDSRQIESLGISKSLSSIFLLISFNSAAVIGRRVTPAGGLGHRPFTMIFPPVIPAPGSFPISPSITMIPPDIPPPILLPAFPLMNMFPPFMHEPASSPHPSRTEIFPDFIP